MCPFYCTGPLVRYPYKRKPKQKGVIYMTIFTVLFAIVYAPFHIIFRLGKRYY